MITLLYNKEHSVYQLPLGHLVGISKSDICTS